MASLFDEIRDGFREGIALVADKADEYTKIGKLQVEILGVQRNIDKLFSELGGRTYEILKEGDDRPVAEDEEIKRLISELRALEDQLNSKKREIESVKAEKENLRKDRAGSRSKTTADQSAVNSSNKGDDAGVS